MPKASVHVQSTDWRNGAILNYRAFQAFLVIDENLTYVHIIKLGFGSARICK